MKKSLLIGIVGLGIGVTSSFGQGSIAFDTYFANNSNGLLTTFGAGSGGSVGSAVNSTFIGELLYSTTPITDPIGTAANIGNALNPSWTVGSTGTFGVGDVPGYVTGPNLVIPSYTSGAVYFEVIAFTGGTNYDSSPVRGHSASFSQSMATGVTPPWYADGNPSGLLGSGSGIYTAFSVYAVPEPTTMALGALGGLSLLLFRRKQS